MKSFAILLCLLALPAYAADGGFQNYDGDTLRATFRIENIDTPELGSAQCPQERRLAEQARGFTRAWLAFGKVTIQQTGIDRFGRVLARVSRGNEDLREALVSKGLAQRWDGKRRSWCG